MINCTNANKINPEIKSKPAKTCSPELPKFLILNNLINISPSNIPVQDVDSNDSASFKHNLRINRVNVSSNMDSNPRNIPGFVTDTR